MRHQAPGRPPDPPFPFRRFRQLRFGAGLTCPRCGGDHVQRWGRFGSRRRYRCRGCRRTFSDFTGTPLAYLKRIEIWPRYCALALQTTTIRRSAHLLGLHPSSAFRWRHRLLANLRQTEPVRLRDLISVDASYLAYSEKGSRSLLRPPRQRGFYGFSWQGPVAWVAAAVDSRGGSFSAFVPAGKPDVEELVALLEHRIEAGATLLGPTGPYGPVAGAARKLGLGFARARDAARLEGASIDGASAVEPARLYLVRWRRWLRRFCGVATRYLDHYLVWFRLLERVLRQSHLEEGSAGGIRRLLLLGAFP